MFQSCPDPFCHALSVIQLIVSPVSAFEYAVFQRFFVNDCAVEHPPDLVLQPERFRRRLYRCRYIAYDAWIGYEPVHAFHDCREQSRVGDFYNRIAAPAYPFFLMGSPAIMYPAHRFTAVFAADRNSQLENIGCAVNIFLCVPGSLDFLRFIKIRFFDDGGIGFVSKIPDVLDDAFQPCLVPGGSPRHIFHPTLIERGCDLQQGLSVQIGGMDFSDHLALGWMQMDCAVFNPVPEGDISYFHGNRFSFPHIFSVSASPPARQKRRTFPLITVTLSTICPNSSSSNLPVGV